MREPPGGQSSVCMLFDDDTINDKIFYIEGNKQHCSPVPD